MVLFSELSEWGKCFWS